METNPKGRLLAANLVDEEANEFIEAMGFKRTIGNDGKTTLVPSGKSPNLVAAADAIGDILVVTYGAAVRMGIDAYKVFAEVNRSNMTKVWPDGKVHRREPDGKVIKPANYSPANVAKVLEDQTAEGTTKWLVATFGKVKQAVSRGLDVWSYLASEACGVTFKFSYQLAEQVKNQNNPMFAGVNLTIDIAKFLAKFQGRIDSPSVLEDQFNLDRASAVQVYDLFSDAFPGFVVARPEHAIEKQAEADAAKARTKGQYGVDWIGQREGPVARQGKGWIV
jgi:hypothetical protein